MKKLSLTLATLSILVASWASAGSTLPEPCIKSTLCSGLLEVYSLDQVSDDASRFGAFMGQLYEPVGVNIGTAVGMFGNAVDLTGTATSYLWANGGGGLPTTTGFWMRADTFPANGNSHYILSRSDTTRPGPYVILTTDGAGTHVQIAFFSVDNSANVSVTSGVITVSAWHYIAVGTGIAKDASGVPIGAAPFVSIDGAAKTYGATIGFTPHPGSWQFRIGTGFSGAGPDSGGTATQSYDGRLDQLTFWGRELTNSEISLIYNAGAGRAYPFVTE